MHVNKKKIIKLYFIFKEYLYITLTTKNQINNLIKKYYIFTHSDIHNESVDNPKFVMFTNLFGLDTNKTKNVVVFIGNLLQ